MNSPPSNLDIVSSSLGAGYTILQSQELLHIRAGSSDGVQENLVCQISELYFHNEVKTMSESEKHNMIFVELILSSPTPASTHSFIARLTHPIVMHINSRVGIQKI